MLPFDLHVLGLPLAFILSQDQTLHCSLICPVASVFKAEALGSCSQELFSILARCLNVYSLFLFALQYVKELKNIVGSSAFRLSESFTF
jgi:hypothetical protein